MARILVSHEVHSNANGDVVGLRFRKHSGAGVVQNVEREYLHKEDGHRVVRTSSGDTWKCREVNHKDYEFVTVV